MYIARAVVLRKNGYGERRSCPTFDGHREQAGSVATSASRNPLPRVTHQKKLACDQKMPQSAMSVQLSSLDAIHGETMKKKPYGSGGGRNVGTTRCVGFSVRTWQRSQSERKRRSFRDCERRSLKPHEPIRMVYRHARDVLLCWRGSGSCARKRRTEKIIERMPIIVVKPTSCRPGAHNWLKRNVLNATERVTTLTNLPHLRRGSPHL